MNSDHSSHLTFPPSSSSSAKKRKNTLNADDTRRVTRAKTLHAQHNAVVTSLPGDSSIVQNQRKMSRASSKSKQQDPPPPIVAPPIVAPPIVAPPIVAPPIVAPPIVAPPIVAPPIVAPPAAPIVAPPPLLRQEQQRQLLPLPPPPAPVIVAPVRGAGAPPSGGAVVVAPAAANNLSDDELGGILSAVLFVFIHARMAFYNVGGDFGRIDPWATFWSLFDDMMGIALIVVMAMVTFVPRVAWAPQLIGMGRVLARYTWRIALFALLEMLRQRAAMPALVAYHSSWATSDSCILALSSGGTSRFDQPSASYVLDCVFPFVQVWNWWPIIEDPGTLCEPVIAEPGQCMGLRFGQVLSTTNRANFWISACLFVAGPLTGVVAYLIGGIVPPQNIPLLCELHSCISQALNSALLARYAFALFVRMCLAYVESWVTFYLVGLSTTPRASSDNEPIYVLLRTALGFVLFGVYTLLAVFVSRLTMKSFLHGDSMVHAVSRDVFWAAVSAFALPWVNAITFGELDMLIELLSS
jgi:hypothetical protein